MSCTCRRHAVCPEHLGLLEGRLLDSWKIIDRWWTENPIERAYRVMSRDGKEIVEVSEGGGPWVPA
jgi:hypothetical protein